MPKICTNTWCQQPFEVTEADRSFLDKVSPIMAGQKYVIPEPTLCPHCRQQRRLAWRNERKLYWRKCDGTGNTILSVFTPDYKGKVYDIDYWWSDKWDALQYGRDYDFSKTFFDQFYDLILAVPQLSRSAGGNINCDYMNQGGWNKNCYLIFEGNDNQDCMHSGQITDSRSCIDCLQCTKSELCYECIDIKNCYALKYSQNCETCSDSAFLKNCIGCKNCFGSVNLRNKEHYYLNQELSKEEYERKMLEVDLSNHLNVQHWKRELENSSLKFAHKYLNGTQNEDSTGDYINNTQRCSFCFDVNNAQDCAYCYYAHNINNVRDMNVFGAQKGAEWCYEVHEVGDGVKNILFSDQVWSGCHNVLYSKLCPNSSRNLFGCVGLRNGEYCVLNRKYSQSEYEKLVERIIRHMQSTGEWGQFAPGRISPHGYNETMASMYYPLSKEQALSQGFRWSDYEAPPPRADKSIPGQRLPDTVSEIPEDILNWAIICEFSGKPFKIVSQELRFYRNQNIPVPHCHPEVRYEERFEKRNPRQLWTRNCYKCQTSVQTTYRPTRPEQILCETCYQQAVH